MGGGGWGNKLAHLRCVDFHVLKNVHRLESKAGTTAHLQ